LEYLGDLDSPVRQFESDRAHQFADVMGKNTSEAQTFRLVGPYPTIGTSYGELGEIDETSAPLMRQACL